VAKEVKREVGTPAKVSIVVGIGSTKAVISNILGRPCRLARELWGNGVSTSNMERTRGMISPLRNRHWEYRKRPHGAYT
jgi:hypothetical protein